MTEQERIREEKLNREVPVIDLKDAQAKSMTGGNHGTIMIDPNADKPPVTLRDRLLAAINRAAAKFAMDNSREQFTPEQRKRLAADYREMADRMERG